MGMPLNRNIINENVNILGLGMMLHGDEYLLLRQL